MSEAPQNFPFPSLMIGDIVYGKGHGNRQVPEEWKVYYLGYNGIQWEYSIARYQSGDFVESLRISDDNLDNIMFFRSYADCLTAIENRQKHRKLFSKE